MELATSDNDHEALSALRKANALIAEEGVTWTRVLDRSITIVQEFETAAEADGVDPDEADDMDDLFERALDKAHGDFRNVILDIQAQWERKHWLSPKQRGVVERAASR